MNASNIALFVAGAHAVWFIGFNAVGQKTEEVRTRLMVSGHVWCAAVAIILAVRGAA